MSCKLQKISHFCISCQLGQRPLCLIPHGSSESVVVLVGANVGQRGFPVEANVQEDETGAGEQELGEKVGEGQEHLPEGPTEPEKGDQGTEFGMGSDPIRFIRGIKYNFKKLKCISSKFFQIIKGRLTHRVAYIVVPSKVQVRYPYRN